MGFSIEFTMYTFSLWIGALLGVFIGWMWKPRWISVVLETIRNTPCESWSSSQGPVIHGSLKKDVSSSAYSSEVTVSDKNSSNFNCSSQFIRPRNGNPENAASSIIGEEDLLYLHRKVRDRDGGLKWNKMMERASRGMTYQAWYRDPQDGTTEYKSQTVFEDSTPELVKDFYWDDEFRLTWDDMLISAKSLECCTVTGSEIVRWEKKFPFFCSNREYLIGRRIFAAENSFYCITKCVRYEGLPQRGKPLRVTAYYSSWCIRPVESRKKKGQLTACEVLLFHSEDMLIPKRIARIGVRQGMWGYVKKMEPSLRKYQEHRATVKSLSHSASMAQIFTRVHPEVLVSSSSILSEELNCKSPDSEEDKTSRSVVSKQSENEENAWKWVILGGAVIFALTLNRGVLGRAATFGLAGRFGRLNQRLR